MRKYTAVILLLLTALAASAGRSSPAQRQWSLYDLLGQAPLVVQGDISIDFLFEFSSYQMNRLENGKVLPNRTSIPANLYIISGHPTTGANTPPWFSTSRYLLFLTPVSDATWERMLLERSQRLAKLEEAGQATRFTAQPLPDRALVHEVASNWKGAIRMNAEHPDLASQAIRHQYGITDPEIIVQSVRQVLALIHNGTPFTSTNPLTDAFMQQFDAARSAPTADLRSPRVQEPSLLLPAAPTFLTRRPPARGTAFKLDCP